MNLLTKLNRRDTMSRRNTRARIILWGIWVAVVIPLLTIAHAQNLTVNPNAPQTATNYKKIQDAINNATPGATITVSFGLYHEHLTVNVNNLEIVAHNVTLAGRGLAHGGPPLVNITATGAVIRGIVVTDNFSITGAGFRINEGASASLIGVTAGALKAYAGGGIANWGNLTIANDETNSSWIINNTATWRGGGIYNYRGDLSIHDSHVDANKAKQGGGIFNHDGHVRIYAESSISENDAVSGAGIYTGGDPSESSVLLEETFVVGNGISLCEFGGGLMIDGSMVKIEQTVIEGNLAYVSGGGVYLWYGSLGPGILGAAGNVITENGSATGPGGGIFRKLGQTLLAVSLAPVTVGNWPDNIFNSP